MGLKIRIPKHIWNDYQPQPQSQNPDRPLPKPKLVLRLPPAPTAIKAREVKRRKRNILHKKAPSCKVKRFQFHYGGQDRRRKGKWQNEIAYEQPCLEGTCRNCAKWHPHLVRNLAQSPAFQAFHDSSLAKSSSHPQRHDIPFRAKHDVNLHNSRDKEHGFDRLTCITFRTEEGKRKFRKLVEKIEVGKEEQ